MAVDPVTNMIYAIGYPDPSLIVINGAANTVVATLASAPWPSAVAVDSLTNTIYVAVVAGIEVYDGATDLLTGMITNVGYCSTQMALDETSDTLYACGDDGGIAEVNLASGSVTILPSTVLLPGSTEILLPSVIAYDPVTDELGN